MAELGALSLRIEATGDREVLAALDAIDTKSARTGSKPLQFKVSDKELKALSQAIDASVQQYSLFARTVDAGSKQAVASMRQLQQEQLAYLQSTGASETQMLRFAAAVQTFEKRVTAAGVAEKAAATAGITAIERRITLLSKGATLDATRADAVRGLIAVEAALTSTLARGNATVEQRIILAQALARTQAGIASGIGQVTQAVNRGAAVQAVAAQQFQVFGRDVVQANGKLSAFGKSGLTVFNGLAFGASQLAASGTASFRSLAAASASMLAFFGPQGAIAAGVIATGLVFADFFTRTKKDAQETADELNKLVLAGNQRFATQQPVSAARIVEARRQAEVDRLNAEIKAKQSQIDKPGTTFARAGLTSERKALETELKTATFALTEAQNKVADALRATGDAAAEASDKEVAALATTLAAGKATNAERQRATIYIEQAQRALAELTRANRVDAESVSQRAALMDRIKTLTDAMAEAAKRATKAEEERRRQIAEEIAALGTLAKARGLTGVEVVRLVQLERTLTQELLNGQPTKAREAEIWDQITRARQAAAQALPAATVRDLTPTRNPTGRPTLIGGTGVTDTGAAQQLPLPNIPVPTPADMKAAADRMQANWDAAFGADLEQQLAQSLAGVISAGIINGFAQGLGEGGIGEGFKQMAAQMLSGLGSLAIEYGLKAKAVAKLMEKVAAFLVANPVLAIAGGIALVALGRSIGGRGNGGRAGAGGGGGFGGGGAGGSDVLQSFVFGENAFSALNTIPERLRDTVRYLRDATVPSAPTWGPPGRPVYVNSPEGSRMVAQAVSDHRVRGG